MRALVDVLIDQPWNNAVLAYLDQPIVAPAISEPRFSRRWRALSAACCGLREGPQVHVP